MSLPPLQVAPQQPSMQTATTPSPTFNFDKSVHMVTSIILPSIISSINLSFNWSGCGNGCGTWIIDHVPSPPCCFEFLENTLVDLKCRNLVFVRPNFFHVWNVNFRYLATVPLIEELSSQVWIDNLNYSAWLSILTFSYTNELFQKCQWIILCSKLSELQCF